ncbi:receptor recognizing protein [Enterobacter phage vB-EclM_KMB19]|nr:receptor recognizing protein [Enterobacter phage vB-EclM_KMB19]
MAISGPNIGTSAFNETGQRAMSAARARVRLVASPGRLSEMIGRSVEITITLGSNHSYDRNDLINKLRALGSTPAVVVISGNLVAQNTGVPCLEFPSNLPNEYVHLRVNANIYGRGGQGGTAGVNVGQNGGPCILNSFGTRLRIENNAAICGGGGGGGGARVGKNLASGGSGGRPFGPAGLGEGRDSKNGIAGTLDAPGPQPPDTRYGSHGGAGGQVGAAGAPGNKAGDQAEGYVGGQPGAAVYGNAPTWIKVGSVYGSRV